MLGSAPKGRGEADSEERALGNAVEEMYCTSSEKRTILWRRVALSASAVMVCGGVCGVESACGGRGA
eukprot:12739807-Alexandrium_andersonii.AAC.1